MILTLYFGFESSVISYSSKTDTDDEVFGYSLRVVLSHIVVKQVPHIVARYMCLRVVLSHIVVKQFSASATGANV